MPDGEDQQLEQNAVKPSRESADSIAAEVDSGRQGLLERDRALRQQLEEGGSSGVSGQFPKPEWLLSAAKAAQQSADRTGFAPDSSSDQRQESVNKGDLDKGAEAGKAGGRRTAGDTGQPLTASDRSLFPVDADGRDYHGEGIARNVQPGTHTVEKGEKLEKIARDYLGAGASTDDIKRYAKELEKINHLEKGKVTEGQVLNMPGHSGDGQSFIVKDMEGGTKVVHPNGSFELEMRDGSKYFRSYHDDGSYVEQTSRPNDGEKKWCVHSPPDASDKEKYQELHGGPRLEDNYSIEHSSDGKYKVKDKDGEKTVDKYDENNPDARVERARLRDLAEKNITNPQELKRFEEDMVRFEARSAKLEETYQKQLQAEGKSPEDAAKEAHKRAQEETARTYHELSRLMETTEFGKTSLKPPMGAYIAERTLYHLADPTTIDQGLHPTCQTATVEARTFTNDPSKAAKLIADVTITGKYTTPDGKTTVEVDPKVLDVGQKSIAAGDPALGYPPEDGVRSYVSQVFQVTAINVELQRRGRLSPEDGSTMLAPGKVRFEQRDPDPSKKPPDDGGRLVDISDPAHPKDLTEKDKKGKDKPITSPSLTDDQITDMSNALTGRKEKAVIIDSKDWVSGDGKQVTKVETEDDLKRALQEAKDKGQLPIVVGLDTRNPPFWGDSGFGKAGGEPGAHVVTITDYQPGPPAKVEIDNQWGKRMDYTGDNAMDVHNLFIAMHPAGRTEKDKDGVESDKNLPLPDGTPFYPPVEGAIDILQRDVDSGKADAATQMELVRQKLIHDLAHKKDKKEDFPPFYKDNKELEAAITKVCEDAMKRFAEQKAKGDGSYNSEEEHKATQEMMALLDELPPGRKPVLAAQVMRDMDKFYKQHPELKPKK